MSAITHMASGMNALLPKPQLGVKAAWVHQAMRLFEPGAECPSFTRMHHRQCFALAIPRHGVPTELNLWRYLNRASIAQLLGAVHLELKPHTIGMHLGHVGNDTRHGQVHALQLDR